MQKIIGFTFLLFIHCWGGISAQNVSDLEAFEKALKPGTMLTYDVSMSGKKYQLIVILKKTNGDISFDWKTTAPVNTSGTISMTTSAVSKGDALFHIFNGGVTPLDKETSLFLSNKIYSDVLTNTQAGIRINGQADTLTTMSNTIAEVGFTLDGNFISIPAWELQGGSDIKYTVSLIESQKFPLFTRLDLGWTMTLVDIKSQP